MDSLNYNHLHHFWVVGSEGSLTRAARRLRLTHSTLSSQLRQLEERVGQRLFVRKSRGIALTPFGEQLKARCDELFRVGAEIADAVRGGRVEARAVVRVGAIPSLPRTLLYRALSTMSGGAALAVTTADAERLVDALVAGRLHVVLTDRPPSTSVDSRVYAHLLGEHRVLLFGSERIARALRPRFPRSLDGAPLLLPPFGSALREGLLRWLAEERINARVVGEIDDVPLMKTFAENGRGVIPVREPLAAEARQRYGLRLVGAPAGVRSALYALTPERRIRHPDVQRLVDECRRRLAL